MEYSTLPYTKVPVPMREPFILTGYRLLNQPWTYYVMSLFKWHNETLAVWSHLLATIIIIVQTLHYGQTYDLVSNPEGNKILMFSIGCVSMTASSAIAHLMSSKSTKSHYIFYLFDYSGIALYSYSIGMASMYIFSNKPVYDLIEPFYIPVTVVISVVTFVMNSIGKMQFTNTSSWQRKTLMIAPYIVYGVWLTAPAFPRYWICFYDNECSLTSLTHVSLVIVFFVVTATIFSLHMPEKWRPGRYDNIGQSHQAFHLSSLVTILIHLAAIRIEIERGASQHATFNLTKALLGFLAVFAINTVIIVYHIPHITQKSHQFQRKKRK